MSKNKKISIVSVSALLVVGIFVTALYLYNPIELKASEVNIEFGKAIPTEADFYVKSPKGVKIKIDTKKIEDKDFEACGEYEVLASKDFFGFKKRKKDKSLC